MPKLLKRRSEFWHADAEPQIQWYQARHGKDISID
jgi:hypothetical protein